MTGEIFTLEQLLEIVRESYQVEDRLTVTPVKPRWMDVPVNQAMFVDVCNCRCDLTEDEQKACG